MPGQNSFIEINARASIQINMVFMRLCSALYLFCSEAVEVVNNDAM